MLPGTRVKQLTLQKLYISATSCLQKKKNKPYMQTYLKKKKRVLHVSEDLNSYCCCMDF